MFHVVRVGLLLFSHSINANDGFSTARSRFKSDRRVIKATDLTVATFSNFEIQIAYSRRISPLCEVHLKF